jgi:hypothetical protein
LQTRSRNFAAQFRDDDGVPATRIRLIAAAVCAMLACGRVPDVGAFTPVLREDGHVLELLREADSLAERDPPAAARNLRTVALPRARANWEAAGQIVVTHPRARELEQRLVRLTGERADTIETYASVLEHNDAVALRDIIHRQVVLDRAMDRLEGDIQAASHAPADHGCSVAPNRP